MVTLEEWEVALKNEDLKKAERLLHQINHWYIKEMAMVELAKAFAKANRLREARKLAEKIQQYHHRVEVWISICEASREKEDLKRAEKEIFKNVDPYFTPGAFTKLLYLYLSEMFFL
jgi:thioredoxin-like negative regulator of GroEL